LNNKDTWITIRNLTAIALNLHTEVHFGSDHLRCGVSRLTLLFCYDCTTTQGGCESLLYLHLGCCSHVSGSD
jgi:hypothetical protein